MLYWILGGVVLTAGLFWAYKRSRDNISSWRFTDIPDQSGKVVICTGANSGVGFEFSRHMARKKAHVILACRDKSRGEEALKKIREENPNASVELRLVDISNKDSIKAFASGVLKDCSRVDILCNNAGINLQPPKIVSGVENTIVTNSFGPFLLTGLLLPLVTKTAGSRIVTVASDVHKMAKRLSRESLADPNSSGFSAMFGRYCLSKGMNLSFGKKLAKLLQKKGHSTLSIICSPGATASNLFDYAPPLVKFVLSLGLPLVTHSPEKGSANLLRAATDSSVPNGDFIAPTGLGELSGWPGRNAPIAGVCLEQAFEDEMWQWSEEWTGFKYPL